MPAKGKWSTARGWKEEAKDVASPLIAGNHLILASEDGLISTVGTGDEFRILGQFELGESIQVTPALGQNTLSSAGKTTCGPLARPKIKWPPARLRDRFASYPTRSPANG